jgi:hypothetical protein
MSETLNFHEDKPFKTTKEKIERKTTYHKRKELVDKALSTRYFVEHTAAAQELLKLLNREDEPDEAPDLLQKTEEKKVSAKVKREPVVPSERESIPALGQRLVNNGEHQKALDLYLSDKNIKEYGRCARRVVFYFKDQKQSVAQRIFDYLQKDPEKAEILAECAKELWADKEAIAREIILKWVQDITGIKPISIDAGEKTKTADTSSLFWFLKKFFSKNSSKILLEKMTTKTVDTLVCLELMSAMEKLWWCKKEIQILYTVFVWSQKTRGDTDRYYLIKKIYEKSTHSTSIEKKV